MSKAILWRGFLILAFLLLLVFSYASGACQYNCKQIHWVKFSDGTCIYYDVKTCNYQDYGKMQGHSGVYADPSGAGSCQLKQDFVTVTEFTGDCAETCAKPYPYPEEGKGDPTKAKANGKSRLQYYCETGGSS